MKRFLQFKYTGAVLLALWVHFAVAQNVRVDQTFNPDDIGSQIGVGFDANVINALFLPDGKILAMGAFSTYNGTAAREVAKLNADGTLDQSFNTTTGASGGQVQVGHDLPDGKILIAGQFTSYKSVVVNRIARLNADATLDATFNSGSGFNSTVSAMQVQTNGKIIVSGAFTTYNGTARASIARLNADGTLDTSFDPGTGPSSGTISDIAVQTDGRIIVVGTFTSFNGVSRNRIVRLNTDGTVDPTFDTGTGADGAVMQVKYLGDGKILIGGSFNSYNSNGTRHSIVRLNPDGSPDPSFTSPTTGGGVINRISVQADGEYLVAGSFTSINGIGRSQVARLNMDGSLDQTINAGTRTFATSITPVASRYDGRILIMGVNFKSYNGAFTGGLVQLTADGVIDETFVSRKLKGFDAFVNEIVPVSAGKVFIAGAFNGYNGDFSSRIIKLNADGSRDGSFTTSEFAGVDIGDIEIDAAGRIVVAGSITFYNKVSRNGIARLNSDGTLDETFSPGTGVTNGTRVNVICIQPDGKILAAGNFTTFNGVAKNALVRLNTDGSIDGSFNPSGPNVGPITSLALQPDGKILVGGGFLSFNGVGRHKLARLNSDGTLDASFIPALTDHASVSLNSIALQQDGKILVAGNLTSIGIRRLNADGSLDNTFTPLESNMERIALLPDGKVVGIGQFSGNLVKLNSDGTPDYFSYTGGVPNPRALAITEEGLYVGGSFTQALGVGRNRIARLKVLIPLTTSGILVNDKIYDRTTEMTLGGTPVLEGVRPEDVGNVVLNMDNVVASVSNKNVGEAKPVTVTGITLTGTAADRYTVIQPTGLTGRISPKPITVDGLVGAEDKVYDGSVNADILGTPVPGDVLAGDDVTVTGVTAVFDSRHAGTSKLVTVSGITATGADWANYTIADGITFLANITPRPVQVQVLVTDKVYDGTKTGSLFEGTVIGKEEDDFVFVDGSNAIVEFEDENVGNSKSVSITNLALAGQHKDNYVIENTTANTFAHITKKQIVVKADDLSRPYGQANPSPTISYIGLAANDDVSEIDEEPVAEIDASATLEANAGSMHAITLSGGADDNYEFEFEDGTLEIVKATATVIISDLTTTYDGSAKSVTVTTVPADLATSITYNGSATLPINAGSYDVEVMVDNVNYQGVGEEILTIEKATATITLTDVTTTYDGTAKTVEVALTPSDLSANVTYKKDGLPVESAIGAGIYNVEAFVDDDNYQSSTATATLTINKRAAVVVLSGLTTTYDGLIKGVIATTTPSGLLTSITYKQNNVVASPVNAGTYSVEALISDANYEGSANDIFTINKATQTISYTELPDRFTTDNPFGITASASSGLPVTISIASGPATYSNGLLSLTGATGTVLVRYEQAGNANYEAATAVSDVFEVLEDPIMSAEQPLERSILVYPVPAKSRLTIAVSNADYSLSHVNLYDLSGTVLKRERLEGVKSFEISVDEYPAGVLLMEVMTSNHEKMIKRIVIIK